MANIEDYNAKLDVIQSILDEAIALAVVGIATDMIQDLNDIAVLSRENPDPLTAIGFDLTQLDRAATSADELANLLVEANGDKADPNESKIIRDKAYTYMKALADEIREVGKYVFRNIKTGKKAYRHTAFLK